MTRLNLCLCLLFLGVALLSASTLNRLEYFLDIDPGLGLGTEVPITIGQDINTSFNLDISNEEPGLHSLCIRVRDDTGKWSLINYKLILITTNASCPISYLEYFFDHDPGYHQGTPLPFSGSTDVSCLGDIPLANLSNGLHFLYLRCKNDMGQWSPNYSHMVFKGPMQTPPLVQAEVFFDVDPGTGHGIPLIVESGTPNEYAINFSLDESMANPGMHLMFVRVKNSGGYWSQSIQKFIYLGSGTQSELKKVQWYFTGNGADPQQLYTMDLAVPTTDLTLSLEASIAHLQQDGEYQLHLCCTSARNQQSLEQVFSFTADFSPNHLSISFGTDTLTLSWDEIPGADSYLVNYRTEPLQAPGVNISTDTNSLSLPLDSKGFFSVKAQSNE